MMPEETKQSEAEREAQSREAYDAIPDIGDDRKGDAALSAFVAKSLPLLMQLDPYRRGLALDMLSTLDERPRAPRKIDQFLDQLVASMPAIIAGVVASHLTPAADLGANTVAQQKPGHYELMIDPERLAELVRTYGRDAVATIVRSLGYEPDSFDELKTIVTPPPEAP